MLDCNYYIEVQGGLVVLVVEGKNCAVAPNKEHRLEQMGSGHLADGHKVSFDYINIDSMCYREVISYLSDLDMILEVNSWDKSLLVSFQSLFNFEPYFLF